MADIPLIRSLHEAYVTDSNDALELKLVRQVSDVEDDNCAFKPEMSHQVFGESESIFGYRDLKIRLYYTAGKLTTYLGITYNKKVRPEEVDGIKPDDVSKLLVEKLQPGFLTNLDDFRAAIDKDANFKPYGELIHSFSLDKGDGDSENKPRCFEVYKCDVTTRGFQDYHDRLQMFVLWYIDAASFIDIDDDKWRFFVAYEKYHVNGNPMYAVAGYTTIYQYYAFPDNIRPRISQMLVLPPFQKMSLGTQLLSTVYKEYVKDPHVMDITVEDPSDEFQRLRDFVDVKNCRLLASFSPDKLRLGFSDEMAKEARDKLKINKKQARRVYEILRLHHTNHKNQEDCTNYRLDVKRRLNMPYQKEQSAKNKLKNVLRENEYNAMMQFDTPEQRHQILDRQYKELEEQYRRVLERLAATAID